MDRLHEAAVYYGLASNEYQVAFQNYLRLSDAFGLAAKRPDKKAETTASGCDWTWAEPILRSLTAPPLKASP